jgi:hypothetical protein
MPQLDPETARRVNEGTPPTPIDEDRWVAWTAAATGDEGELQLRVAPHFKLIDGRRECVGIEIWSARPPKRTMPNGSIDKGWLIGEDGWEDERPLRATDLRRAPLESLVRYALESEANSQLRNLRARFEPAARTTESPRQGGGARGRPRKFTDAVVEWAAHIYASQLELGQPATQAVATELDISYKAAERVIARARSQFPDLLPPPQRGSRRRRKPEGETSSEQ